MIFSKLKLQKFTEILDKTAEKNPFIRPPCILLLAVILGAEKLFGAFRAVAAKLKAVSSVRGCCSFCGMYAPEICRGKRICR